ncbi:MAG: hypothetical protein ACRCX2_38905 [Paraclostridium sp.]
MRVIRIILKNHIVLGDIDIKLDSDIIMLYGLNGSGKSFLLSLIHPYAETISMEGHYPIVPYQTGYKQIDYEINGTIYSTRHEYNKNKETHSAKSYLLKQNTKGGFDDLNPNGNRNTYKELINTHFGYSADLEDIVYLHQKTCGIISAPQSKRLEFLKVLIRDEINKLEEYQTGCEVNYRKFKSLMNANRKKIEQYGNSASIMSNIDEIDNDILIIKDAIENETTEYMNNKVDLETIENSKGVVKSTPEFIGTLSKILDNINSISNTENNLAYYKMEYDGLVNSIAEVKLAVANETTNIEAMDIGEFTDIDRSKELLKEVEEEMNMYYESGGKYYNTELQYKLPEIISTLRFIAENNFSENDIEIIWEIATTSKYLVTHTPKNKIEQYNKDINDLYRQIIAIDEIIPPDVRVNESDECKTCGLYAILDNQVKTKQKNISLLEQIEIHRKSIIELEEHIQKIDELSKTSDALVHYSTMIRHIDDVVPKLDKDMLFQIFRINTEISKLNSISENIKHYGALYKRRERILLDISNYGNLKEKYDKLKSSRDKIDSLMNTLRVQENRLDVISDCAICPQSLQYHSVQDLNNLKKDMIQRDARIIELKELCRKSENTLEQLNKRLEEANQKKGELSNMRTVIKTISDEMEDLSNDLSDLEMLREVLNKDIPKSLILSRLQPIQQIVNSTLDKLNINMQLNILLDSNNIKMEVIRDERITPDTKLLSSGETAIIGLLVNIVLCDRFVYNVVKLDEIDSNLDYDLRDKYKEIVNSITSLTGIEQVFIISHNMNDVLDNAQVIQIGKYSNINNVDNIIKL